MIEKNIQDKLSMIESVLDAEWKSTTDFSLFSGIGGIPLFYAMMFMLKKENKYKKRIIEIIEELFDRLNSNEFSMTYDSGISGIAYMLEFLRENRFIKNELIVEHLEFFDEIILNFCSAPINNINEIDFLHGRLGAANYLLKRLPENLLIQNRIISIFENIAKAINNDINSYENVKHVLKFDENTHKTNCGLAHGHVSSIIILSKFLQIFPENKIIKNTLSKLVNCLMDFRSANESSLSSFPSIAINKKFATYQTPLGWCYGDQTAALGILKASEILKDSSLKSDAINIAKKTKIRDTVEKSLSPFSDAGFCHGVSSLAYLNKKWYKETNDKKFKELYEYYIRELLDKGNDDLGLAGYRKYSGIKGYEKSIGLLTGITGIGVVLIDYLLEKNELNWERFFLID